MEKPMEKMEIYEKHKKYLAPCVTHYYKEPLILERERESMSTILMGESISTSFERIVTISVGHCDEEIISKTYEQMKKLQHTSTLYPNEAIVSLAEKLAQITRPFTEIFLYQQRYGGNRDSYSACSTLYEKS
jgi:4-aminobutyrate aminotransferase-like enzyme